MSRVVITTLPKRIKTFGMICAATLAVSACQTLGMTAADTVLEAEYFGIGSTKLRFRKSLMLAPNKFQPSPLLATPSCLHSLAAQTHKSA